MRPTNGSAAGAGTQAARKLNFNALAERPNHSTAAAARRAKIAAGARFRRNFMDAGTWEELAKARGIRLPAWWVAPTPGKLKFWLQSLVGEPFRAVYGDLMTPAKLIALNPDWPLRAFVGVMLEVAADINQVDINQEVAAAN